MGLDMLSHTKKLNMYELERTDLITVLYTDLNFTALFLSV